MAKGGSEKEIPGQGNIEITKNIILGVLKDYLSIEKERIEHIEHCKRIVHQFDKDKLNRLKEKQDGLKVTLEKVYGSKNESIRQAAMGLLQLLWKYEAENKYVEALENGNFDTNFTIESVRKKYEDLMKVEYSPKISPIPKKHEEVLGNIKAKLTTDKPSQPKQIYEKGLIELLKDRAQSKNREGENYSIMDVFIEFSEKIKHFTADELNLEPNQLFLKLVEKTTSRGQIIAPEIAQLAIGLGKAKEINCMLDIIKARLLFEKSRRMGGKDKQVVIEHLQKMKAKYFEPPNPVMANNNDMLKYARALCDSTEQEIDDLMQKRAVIFDKLLGDSTQPGAKKEGTLFAELDDSVMNYIRTANNADIKGKLNLLKKNKDFEKNMLKIYKADAKLKKDQKENHERISPLFQAINDFKTNSNDDNLKKLMDEIAKIEKDNDLVRNLNDDLDTFNYIKSLFDGLEFKVKDQEIIASYLNKKFSGSQHQFKIFDKILQPRIKDYERDLIQKMSRDSVEGTKEETALRAHFFSILKKIKKEEFEDLAWSKQDGKEKAPNVYQLSVEIDNLTKFIKQDLLLAKTEDERKKLFNKYIDILSVAIKNHDTGIIFAIYSALMVSPEITKLKIYETMDNKDKVLGVLNLAEKIVSPSSSYKFQRAYEKEAGVEPPLVKGITTLLNDLTFAHDGNLDSKDNLTSDGKEIMDRIIGSFFDSNDQMEVFLSAHPDEQSAIIKQMHDTALIFDDKTANEYSSKIQNAEPGGDTGPYLLDRINRAIEACRGNSKSLKDTIEEWQVLIKSVEQKLAVNDFDSPDINKMRTQFFQKESLLGVIDKAKAAENVHQIAVKYLESLDSNSDIYKEIKQKSDIAKQLAEEAWKLVDQTRETMKDISKTKAKLPKLATTVTPTQPIIAKKRKIKSPMDAFGELKRKLVGEKQRDITSAARAAGVDSSVAAPTLPQRTTVLNAPDENQKYFAECFKTLVDYANTLEDVNLKSVFDELKSKEKYKESPLLENGEMKRIPKIGEIYEVGWPYSHPSEKFKARGEQIIIDAFKTYKPTDPKIVEAGSCMEQLNYIRTQYDMILMILRNESGAKKEELYDMLSGQFNGYEINLKELSQKELMKKEPYSSIQGRLAQIKEELLNQVGADFKQHFEQWKAKDKELREAQERRLAERQKQAAAGAAPLAGAGAPQAAAAVSPPPLKRQNAQELLGQLTRSRRAKASVVPVSKIETAAPAAVVTEEERLKAIREKRELNNFLNSFEKEYLTLKQNIKNGINLEKNNKLLAEMENKIRLYGVHPEKEVSQKAIGLMVTLGILGKREPSALKQILSGYKDPTPRDPSKPPLIEKYTEDDVVRRGNSLLEFVKPEKFIEDLISYYNALGDNENTSQNRIAVLGNARILLETMIRSDYVKEFFPDFNDKNNPLVKKFNDFIDAAKEKSTNSNEKRALENLRQKVEEASKEVSARVEKTVAKLEKCRSVGDNLFDITSYISNDLAQGAVSSEDITAKADLLANTLYNTFASHILNLKPSDFHKQAWTKVKDPSKNGVSAFTIDHVNLTSSVTQDIVTAKSKKHLENVVLLYARVIKKAIENGDFATASAIYAGMNKDSAYRMVSFIDGNEEIKNVLLEMAELFKSANSFKNYREAEIKNEAIGKPFIPSLNYYLTDRTFIDEGNPDKEIDGVSIVSEGKLNQLGVFYTRIDRAKKGLSDVTVSPRLTDYFQHRILLDDDQKYAQSLIFIARKPVKLDEIETLDNFIKLFPQSMINTILKVSIGTKEFEGKKAFEELVKIALPLFKNAQLMDKLPNSPARKLFKSMVSWAESNDIDKKFIDSFRKSVADDLTPLSFQLTVMNDVIAHNNKYFETYATLKKEEREQTLSQLVQLKDVLKNDTSLSAHVSEISSQLKQIDKLIDHEIVFRSIKRIHESDVVPLVQRFQDISTLAANLEEINSQLKSKNPVIVALAQKYVVLVDDEMSKIFMEDISKKAAEQLSEAVLEYKKLLIERQDLKAKNKDTKEINDNLEALRKGVMALIKYPPCQEKAKVALAEIDKLVALDRIIKDKLDDTKKKEVARNICPYLFDDTKLIKEWAQKIADEDILARIIDLMKEDLEWLRSFSDKLEERVNHYITEANAKGFADESVIAAEGEVNKLISALDELTKSKLEDVKEEAINIKSQNQSVLTAFDAIIKQKEKIKQEAEQAKKEAQEEAGPLSRIARAFSITSSDVSKQDETVQLTELVNKLKAAQQQPKMARLEHLAMLSAAKDLTEEARNDLVRQTASVLVKFKEHSAKKDELFAKIVGNLFTADIPDGATQNKIKYLNEKIAELTSKRDASTEERDITFYKNAIERLNNDVNDFRFLLGAPQLGKRDKFISPGEQVEILAKRYKKENKTLEIRANDIAKIVKQTQQIANNPNSQAAKDAKLVLDKIKDELRKPENFELLKYCQINLRLNLGIDYSKENFKYVVGKFKFNRSESDTEKLADRKSRGEKAYAEIINTEEAFLAVLKNKFNIDDILIKFNEHKKEFEKEGVFEDEIKDLLAKFNAMYEKQLKIREALDNPDPREWVKAMREADKEYQQYCVAYHKFAPKTMNIRDLLNSVGLNISEVLIKPVQRGSKYDLLLRDLHSFADDADVKKRFKEANENSLIFNKEINKAIASAQKEAFSKELDDLIVLYNGKPTQDNFKLVLDKLSKSVEKVAGDPSILTIEEARKYINRLDFSLSTRKDIRLIESLIDKNNPNYHLSNNALMPYLINKVADDKVIKEIFKLSQDGDITPYQRNLLAQIGTNLLLQREKGRKLDLLKAIKKVKENKVYDPDTRVKTEDALAPFENKFTQIVQIQHKYRPWKIKNLNEAKISDVINSLNALKDDKKYFKHSFPNSSKDDIVKYVISKINEEPMLNLAYAHDVINSLSEIFKLDFNSKERNSILQAYVDRINNLLSEPLKLTNAQKTAIAAFFTEFGYCYRSQLEKTESGAPIVDVVKRQLVGSGKKQAFDELKALHKIYNKSERSLEFNGVSIKLGEAFDAVKLSKQKNQAIEDAFSILRSKAGITRDENISNLIEQIGNLDKQNISPADLTIPSYKEKIVDFILNNNLDIQQILKPSTLLKEETKVAIASYYVEKLGSDKMKELLFANPSLFKDLAVIGKIPPERIQSVFTDLPNDKVAELNGRVLKAILNMDVNAMLALRGFKASISFTSEKDSMQSALSMLAVFGKNWKDFAEKTNLESFFKDSITAKVKDNKDILVSAVPILAAVINTHLPPDLKGALTDEEFSKLTEIHHKLLSVLYPGVALEAEDKSIISINKTLTQQKKRFSEIESLLVPSVKDQSETGLYMLFTDQMIEVLKSDIGNKLTNPEGLNPNEEVKLQRMLMALNVTMLDDKKSLLGAFQEFVSENPSVAMRAPFDKLFERLKQNQKDLIEEKAMLALSIPALEKAVETHSRISQQLTGSYHSLVKGNIEGISKEFVANPAMFAIIDEDLEFLNVVAEKYNRHKATLAQEGEKPQAWQRKTEPSVEAKLKRKDMFSARKMPESLPDASSSSGTAGPSAGVVGPSDTSIEQPKWLSAKPRKAQEEDMQDLLSVGAGAVPSTPAPQKDTRKSLSMGAQPTHVPSQPVLGQESSTLMNFHEFFEEDRKRLEIYGVEKVTPKKLAGVDDHYIMTMVDKKTNPQTRKEETSHVDVHVGASKTGGATYSAKEQLSDQVLINLCKIAVDCAEPGAKFNVPSGGDPIRNKKVHQFLEEAIKARCELHHVNYPGKLEVPTTLPHPVVKMQKK